MKLYDVIVKEKMEKKGVIQAGDVEYPKELFKKKELSVEISERKKRFSFKNIGVLGASIGFIVILYILGMYFVFAKVTIAERYIPFSFDEIVLELDESKSTDDKRLSFQVMKSEATATKQVYTSNLQQTSTKAEGSIVLFNEYRTSAITIKKGTIVTSEKGKKYATQSAITIPAFTGTGTSKKAGISQEVKIIASDVGSDYNSEGTSFTVAGYNKDQVYARSAGAILGGESGVLHVLDNSEKEIAMSDLQANLAERLKREARSSISSIKDNNGKETYITYPDLQVMSIDKNSFVYKGTNIRFPAKLEGEMVSYIIPRDALENALANRIVSDQTYPDVVIPTLSDLRVYPITALPTDIDKIPENISVSISGSGVIVTKVSIEKVKQALLGIPRKAFSGALSSITEIEEAKYIFYPFWAPFFPSIPDRINIIIK